MPHNFKMLHVEEYEKPVAMQIFGSDKDSMVEAAKYIDKNSNCDIIDINMGCPVHKVAINTCYSCAFFSRYIDDILMLISSCEEAHSIMTSMTI